MRIWSLLILLLSFGCWVAPGMAGQETPSSPAGGMEPVKQEIAERWNKSAPTYDSRPEHGVSSQAETQAWQELFSSILPGQGLKVLDVGCGTGEMSFIWAGLGQEVFGVDISEGMLAKAREKAAALTDEALRARLHFQFGDAEALPFPTDSFDAVFARHVLWTLPQPQKAIDDWRRVLKPGGKVIVIDALWDDGSFSTRLRRQLAGWLRYLVEGQKPGTTHYSAQVEAALPHRRGVPLEAAKAYFDRAGLKDLQEQQLTRIADIQKSDMPLWYRLGFKNDYYVLWGQK